MKRFLRGGREFVAIVSASGSDASEGNRKKAKAGRRVLKWIDQLGAVVTRPHCLSEFVRNGEDDRVWRKLGSGAKRPRSWGFRPGERGGISQPLAGFGR